MYKRKNILYLGVFAALILVGAGCSIQEKTDVAEKSKTVLENDEAQKEIFSFSEKEFDFGVIKQSGGKVKKEFPFTYNGSETVKITGVPTSCACTSATVSKTTLKPGETGVVTVIFNPNLHAEPDGKFFKTVSLMTDPKTKEFPEVKIWAEIDLDLGPGAFELKADHDDSDEDPEAGGGIASYTSITPEKLADMLKEKDFTLIDVHDPKQEPITGTDIRIPYDEIEHTLKLPKNKDEKIVLYCRTGGMSRAAAYTLVEKGYTNVYDLVGGKNAYDAYIGSQKK